MSNSILQFRQLGMQEFFSLKSGGDGDFEVLQISGMSGHLPRKDGLIQYERIGPFMPPICFSGLGDIIVSELMYRELSSSDFTDFRVQPVIKAHICRSDWDGLVPYENNWGEPEDQILDKPHDAECSATIGELFELILPTHGNWISRKYNKEWTSCEIVCEAFTGGDFFALQPPNPTSRTPMCSMRFRRWLESNGAARWITFIPTALRIS